MTDTSKEAVASICHKIIRHVSDGAALWENDHAAMIDTLRALRAELDRSEARVDRLRMALRPFASAWAIATASGETSMSRLGSYARSETPAIAFARARAALADKGGE